MAEAQIRRGRWEVSPRRLQPGDVLCMIPGPTKELKREPAGEKWCFGCRAHLPHDDVLLCDEQPSYYDPIWVRRCSRCGDDRTRFPSG